VDGKQQERDVEVALFEAEERFRQAFEHAAIGKALVSLDGRWLEVNPALSGILGRSPAELARLTFQDITHPDDIDADLDSVARLLNGDVRSYQMEKRYIHKDGNPVWVLLSVALVRSITGEPQYFVSQMEDITERKATETALRESEERFRLLADNSTDLILRLTPTATILYASPASHTMLGYEPDDLVGRDALDLVLADDLEQVEADLARVLSSTESVTITFRARRTDGAYTWLESTARALRRDGEIVEIHSSSRDVNMRKTAEEQLQRAHQEMQKLAELKSELMVMVAHELNTPLTPVLGFARLLADHWDEIDNTDRLSYVRLIATRAERLAELVNEVVTTSRLQAGLLQPVLQEANLPSLLEGVLAGMSDPTKVHLDCPTGLVIRTDPNFLRIIVTELLTNALNYGAPPVDVVAVSEDGVLRIEVRDRGTGVPPDFVEHLFDPFAQASIGLERTSTGGAP
jgi:PAS domain S-box-containing protein